MNLTITGHTAAEIKVAKAWLQRAHSNAKAAKVLVENGEPELRVESVTQVQQACEKAIKALLLANGMAYSEVTGLRHNAIGSFVKLIAEMLLGNPFAEVLSQALVKEDGTEAANSLARLALGGSRYKKHKRDVAYAFKQVLPHSSATLGNRALEVDEWDRLTRAFRPEIVEMFIAFQDRFIDQWRQYINEISITNVDPRPLLAKEVQVETWAYSQTYAGLPRGLSGQELDSPTNPILANLAQALLNETVEHALRDVDPRNWPETINIKGVLAHISNWFTSLSWLFLCAIVTTPHAVSSRYPADESRTSNAMGSQDYSEKLGVVACIGPLADHTEQAVQNLINHYQKIENGLLGLYQC